MAVIRRQLSPAALEAWGQSALGGADPPQRDRLLETAVEDFVTSGDFIVDWSHGPGTSLVVGGLARIFRRNLGPHAAGRQVTLGYRGPGQFIGLPSALAPQLTTSMQSAAVEALTDAHVLRVPARRLLEFAASDPAVARVMFGELVATLLEAHELLAENIFLPVRQRVARHLLDLATSHDGVLRVDASQQDIANAIGSVRAVVSRAIVKLREDGLIRREGDAYALVDPASLHRVAAGR